MMTPIIKVNDNTNNQIKFKIIILKSSLSHYSDAYITVLNTAGARQTANNDVIEVVFKNCAPFTDCISELNNTQKIMLRRMIW